MNVKQLVIALLFVTTNAWGIQAPVEAGVSSSTMPKELDGVGITEKLGDKVDLNLEFTDENAQSVRLGHFFNQGRPVMLAIIYYSCPNLCNFQLNGLIDVLRTTKGQAGKDYDLIAVSMDHTETANLAASKKEKYMQALGQVGAEKGWHFLVGSEANVKALSKQVGFSFKWNDELKQYAHQAVTTLLTPAGTISRYLHGVTFDSNTLRLAMVEASDGSIGSFIEHFALFCFQFNPTKNKYTLYAFNIMRVGGAMTILLLALLLVPVWMRERQRKANMA